MGLLLLLTFRPKAVDMPNLPLLRNNPTPNTNCYPASTNVVCGDPTPGPQFLSVTVTNQCVAGAMIVATATYTNIPGSNTITITYSNADLCPALVTTYPVSSIIQTNWWEATGDAVPASGSGLAASFDATNCGAGTVYFHIVYSNAPPCTNGTVSTSIGWGCDCTCTHHTLDPTPLMPPMPPGITSCGQLSGQWTGAVVVTYCGNTAQLTCGDCSAINPHVSGSCCANLLVNGQSVGHCLYEPSGISAANYWKCFCGARIMKSLWTVDELSPPQAGPCANCWYTITWNCTNGLSDPLCYWPDNKPRTCNTNGSWDW